MPKHQRRSGQGGGAERHGRDQPSGRPGGGQASYNTSAVHRETRSQDGKDHHGGGAKRRGNAQIAQPHGRAGTGNHGPASVSRRGAARGRGPR
jgi:hypothetical protein